MTAKTAPTPETEETPKVDETVDEILQTPDRLKIEGIEVEVRRMKTREFFALMRILLRGAGGQLASVFSQEDPEKLAGMLAGMLLAAIPNAEYEFLNFMNQMIAPVREDDAEKLKEILENPELETLMSLVTVIIEKEAGEFTKLGKAARSWWEIQGKAALAGVTNR